MPRILWMAVGLLLLALPCARAQSGGTQIRLCRYNKADYLYLADVARYYGFRMERTGRDVSLVSRHSVMHFMVNSRTATLNGVDLTLSRAVADQNGLLLLGKSDFQYLIDPVIRPKTLPRRQVHTIVIDPGHGGKDTGAIGEGKSLEKDITLQIASRLAYALQKRGFRVFLTRNNDTYISLEQRCQTANRITPDFFVSLHCNATKSPSVCGVETYIATPVGDIAAGSNTVATTACLANKFNLENAWMAYAAQKQITTRTGMIDRGVKRLRYYVVRNTNCPSMLIEMGFLTNRQELAFLKHPYRQQQIADSIADAFSQYRQIVK